MPWWSEHASTLDGGRHEGRLELITWAGEDEDGLPLGWGGVVRDEAQELYEVFLAKYDGREADFFKYWPQGFRWTCCGTTADAGVHGCDHHGKGSSPCTCDYCKAGKPLPARLRHRAVQAAHGLDLSPGPDPRSRSNAPADQLTWVLRTALMPDSDNEDGAPAPQRAPGNAGGGASRGTGSGTSRAAAGGTSCAAAGASPAAVAAASGESGPRDQHSRRSAANPPARCSPRQTEPAQQQPQQLEQQQQQQQRKEHGAKRMYTCDACGATRAGMQRCSSCKQAFYCGSECQIRAWASHRRLCRAASRAAAKNENIKREQAEGGGR